ncbi:MAG: 50S ribosomal protein L20 [Candidatus Buchananbacteria bacterium]|nr:50S ribosomal protein L20 [Candidatus Buchananbacteria bacterium]
MPRVKRGTSHAARRKRLLKKTKGYRWSRRNTIRAAKTAVNKAGTHALRDRRKKKRDNRSTWTIRINAACRANGLTYSKFIKLLKDNKIEADRKALSQLAEKQPKAFAKIVEQIKK